SHPHPTTVIKLDAELGGAVSLSKGGTMIAYVDRHAVKVWSLETRVVETELKGQVETCKETRFSPDGKTLLCIEREGHIVLWDLASGLSRVAGAGNVSAPNLFGQRAEEENEASNVGTAEFSPDGTVLATGHYYHDHLGGGPGEIRVWNLETGDLK